MENTLNKPLMNLVSIINNILLINPLIKLIIKVLKPLKNTIKSKSISYKFGNDSRKSIKNQRSGIINNISDTQQEEHRPPSCRIVASDLGVGVTGGEKTTMNQPSSCRIVANDSGIRVNKKRESTENQPTSCGIAAYDSRIGINGSG